MKKTIFLSFSIKNSSLADYFIELANQMTIKYNVIIITYGAQKHFFEINPEIKIVEWSSNRPTTVKDFMFLSKLVKKYRPEIMIGNFGAVNLFLLVGFLYNVRHRIAWYRTLYGQLNGNYYLRSRKKLIYKLATRIIANSEATKEDLLRNFSVKERKIHVFHNAVRDYNIKSAKVNRNKILYVGRMDHIKGVRILIDAIPLVLAKFPDTEFVLIGGNIESSEINSFLQRIKKKRIQKNVNFLGNLGKAKLLEEFASAYVTVVPSIKEAFGYVVIESFSVKTPVIGSNTSGIAEIIRDNTDGFLFETANCEDLARKINNLLDNDNLRTYFSHNCYSRFKNNFEIRSSTNEIISFLENLENENYE